MNAQQREEEVQQIRRFAEVEDCEAVLWLLTRDVDGWSLHYDSESAVWAVKTAIEHVGRLDWIMAHEKELHPRPQLITHGAGARMREIVENEYTVEVTFGDRTVCVGYETAWKLYGTLRQKSCKFRRYFWWRPSGH